MRTGLKIAAAVGGVALGLGLGLGTPAAHAAAFGPATSSVST